MSEKEIVRLQRWRLGVIRHALEVSHNVAKTCRYYGIGRTAYYEWYKRYQDEGEEGLRDKSRRPLHSPLATSSDVVAKIVYLRQNYHFGAFRIQMYLKRYHDITLSKSGVWRILKRLNMNLLPANQRYKKHKDRWIRYEKPQPGHRIQIDVKFLERLPGKRDRFYQYTAIDDCTRLRVLKIFEKNNQLSAIQFIDYVLSRLPFRAEVIQTDNGSEFQLGSSEATSSAQSNNIFNLSEKLKLLEERLGILEATNSAKLNLTDPNSLLASGSASPVIPSKDGIQLTNLSMEDASISGLLASYGLTISNIFKSLGKTIIPAGKISITIDNKLITNTSDVFTTSSIPVAMGTKIDADKKSFTIEISQAQESALEVSWWIVDTAP